MAAALGDGSTLVLVHGGIGPELSWERQLPLAERWRLLIPERHGYEQGSTAERQDFEADAELLAALLEEQDDPVHLVGFSYGGIAAATVTAAQPRRVRSLTLIEPALVGLVLGHPALRAMGAASARFVAPEGLDDLDLHWQFLARAGIERPDDEGERRRIEELTRMARRARGPAEADVELEPIGAAGIPVLSVSGGRDEAYEVIGDLIAERTGGERLAFDGAPHAVQRVDGFNERLENFLRRAAG